MARFDHPPRVVDDPRPALERADIPQPTTKESTLSPEQEKGRRQIEEFLEEIDDAGYVPIHMIESGKNVPYDRHRTSAAFERPFGVFAVKRKDNPGESLIYKSEIQDTSEGHGLDREITFYKTLLAEAKNQMPPALQDKIVFPELLGIIPAKDGRPKGILLQKLEGQTLGSHETSAVGATNEEDMLAIIHFIAALQKLKPEVMRSFAPSTKVQKRSEQQHAGLLRNRTGYDLAFGKDADAWYAKAQELQRQSEEHQAQRQPMVLSEDVFQQNLMKLPDGKIGSFDWERPYIGEQPNPATDYGKLVTRMWNQSELQTKTIQMILELNKETPGFAIMFRATLAAWEMPWLRKKFDQIITEAKTDPVKNPPERVAEAQTAIPKVDQMFKDLLDGTGPWTENQGIT